MPRGEQPEKCQRSEVACLVLSLPICSFHDTLMFQVGRAGRDGQRAICTTLVSAADIPLLRAMIYGGTPSDAAVRGLLRAMFAGQDDEADFNFYDLSQVGWRQKGGRGADSSSRRVERTMAGCGIGTEKTLTRSFG